MFGAQRVLERRRWCKECQRYVLARENQPAGDEWACLTCLTAGLVIPLMLIWRAGNAFYLCPHCGGDCNSTGEKLIHWLLVGAILFGAVKLFSHMVG